MEICTEILGNLHDPQWKERLGDLDIEYIPLDQWTAQKSRFLAKSERGVEYPIALKRQTQVVDGDIVFHDPQTGHVAALKLDLNPVLVLDLSSLKDQAPETIIRRSLELGHAIGNQHWPAVVKGAKIYVPLTVDKKVMLSVMDTHHLEGVSYEFQPGREVIPYMAPHEIRRLFGGASHENHHEHGPHDHKHEPHDHGKQAAHDHPGHGHHDGIEKSCTGSGHHGHNKCRHANDHEKSGDCHGHDSHHGHKHHHGGRNGE